MEIPELETERLILRAIGLDDRHALFENYSDPEVAKWFFDQAYTQIEQADQLIHEWIKKAEGGSGLTWAILIKESGAFAGTCGYESFDAGRKGEIGFDLSRKFWRLGYMREALGAIITYGFDVLDLVQIEAHTYSHNLRARSVLERLGFRVESATEDSHSYTLVRTDWMRMHR